MADSSSHLLVTATSSPHFSTSEKYGAVMTEPYPLPKDPPCPIKGMYRLLDLIIEQGKDGLGNRLYAVVYATLT